jgi:hypothetical protein
LKVIKQKDDLKKTLRGTLQSALINVRKINNGKNLIAIADSFMNLILSEKVNVGSIAGYKNLQEKFNDSETREMDISFVFLPVYDLNWCVIQMSATTSL